MQMPQVRHRSEPMDETYSNQAAGLGRKEYSLERGAGFQTKGWEALANTDVDRVVFLALQNPRAPFGFLPSSPKNEWVPTSSIQNMTIYAVTDAPG